jgi:tRNA threonylcarbamoyladenosine biosynthesis protein TsaE
VQKAVAVTSKSPEETRILGAALAPILLPGDVVSLNGDLGAGKTVFVQGVAAALGVQARVTSPTFTIVHEYEARYPIVHLDVYRLNSFQEVIDLGFEELLDPQAILLVEWGRAVSPLLPRR